jgi:hypothetical protein
VRSLSIFPRIISTSVLNGKCIGKKKNHFSLWAESSKLARSLKPTRPALALLYACHCLLGPGCRCGPSVDDRLSTRACLSGDSLPTPLPLHSSPIIRPLPHRLFTLIACHCCCRATSPVHGTSSCLVPLAWLSCALHCTNALAATPLRRRGARG